MVVYTVQEVAEIFKVSDSSINRLVKTGKLDSFKIGTVTRITEDAIKKFVEHGGAPNLDENSESDCQFQDSK